MWDIGVVKVFEEYSVHKQKAPIYSVRNKLGLSAHRYQIDVSNDTQPNTEKQDTNPD